MTSTLKRIDPASVPGVFRKHGLKPERGGYNLHVVSIGEHDGCCVLTACAVDRIGREGVGDLDRDLRYLTVAVQIADLIGVDRIYGMHVTRGWDGKSLAHDATPTERAGHADGRAAWQACVEAGLTEPAS